MRKVSEIFQSFLFGDDKKATIGKLRESFGAYSKEDCKNVFVYLKTVLKDKKNTATVKLQVLKVIEEMMLSKNQFVISECGKKFYNRFRILAEFRKEAKDDRRGTMLFGSEGRMQQIASEEFLVLLLGCIRSWAICYPLDHKNKFSQYHKLYNYLLSKGVNFPIQEIKFEKRCEKKSEKEVVQKSLSDIRKNVKMMLDLISVNDDYEKIKRIGEGLKKCHHLIQSEIVKYMEMEDHDLIKDLNQTLDFLIDGKNVFKSWKTRKERVSILDLPQYMLPPRCVYLKDVAPKTFPTPDALSESMQEVCLEDYQNEKLTERIIITEENVFEPVELFTLGADYCRLKDLLAQSEQSAQNFQQELKKISDLLTQERKTRQNTEVELEILTQRTRKQTEEHKEKFDQVLCDCQVLRTTNFVLNERLSEFELKIGKLECELSSKNELIANLEASCAAVTENCRFLEEENDKYIENESSLRREIQELKKKSLKIKQWEEEDTDEVLQMPLRVSLIPGVMLFTPDPGNYEDSDELMSKEQDEQNTAEGYLEARESTSQLPKIDNLPFFKDLLRKRHGLLYENSLIKVSSSSKTSEMQGKLRLIIENISETELINLKTKIFSDPQTGLDLRINTEKTEKLEKNEKLTREIFFECKDVFDNFPWLQISFSINSEKIDLFLLLPQRKNRLQQRMGLNRRLQRNHNTNPLLHHQKTRQKFNFLSQL